MNRLLFTIDFSPLWLRILKSRLNPSAKFIKVVVVLGKKTSEEYCSRKEQQLSISADVVDLSSE
jgi:hypothetical protein